MENIIFEHVEFLLPRHNCVIVPGLGAFIVNFEPSGTAKDHEITPPTYTIVFNNELKHNDGLIVSSLQALRNIPYTTANNIVNDSIKEIKQTLLQGLPVNCGKLGLLNLDLQGNIAFHPNRTIVFPSIYGLSPVLLQSIEALRQLDHVERKQNITIRRIATTAAVIAGLFIFVTPSGNISTINNNQKAGFLDIFSQTITESNHISLGTKPDAEANSIISTLPTSDSSNSTIEKPTRTYYIVVGGEESESQANRLLARFKDQGFPKASIVLGDRYRIYVASFFDKSEAERYLDLFRLENPEYATAWLYSKKNVY